MGILQSDTQPSLPAVADGESVGEAKMRSSAASPAV
jgi:hypothetical protein